MGKLVVTIEGFTYEIELAPPAAGETEVVVSVDGKPVRVLLPDPDAALGETSWLIIDERPYEVALDRNWSWIRSRWGVHALEVQDLEAAVSRPHLGNGRIKAPIPGQISEVLVAVGDEVQAGQPLLILEAMKMENEIRAPRAGRIKAVSVTPGQVVSLHEVLAEIE